MSPPAATSTLLWRAFEEARPGRSWRHEFERLWPAHRAWFLREGEAARPSFLEAERALDRFMPALRPTWERLVELAGGGDLAARALAQYRPPPFFGACSQLVVSTPEPALLRSYDYAPRLFDALVTHTAWNGRRVIGTSDSFVGLLDGMNEDGLAVSLAFGGRRAEGDGFGIGIVLRYVLETCTDVADAVTALSRIPVHVPYNIALVDASGAHATVQLGPDRAPVVGAEPVSTNHQGPIDWPAYATLLETERRYACLEALATTPGLPLASLERAFLSTPLYRTAYARGYGTLYTAVYRPARGEVRYLWPDGTLRQRFDDFREAQFAVDYADGRGAHRREVTALA